MSVSCICCLHIAYETFFCPRPLDCTAPRQQPPMGPEATGSGRGAEIGDARGRGDFMASHDLEDIVTVVDGCPALIDELRAAPPQLREYLAREFHALTSSAEFLDALAGHLPGDAASQARLAELIRRFRQLAQ